MAAKPVIHMIAGGIALACLAGCATQDQRALPRKLAAMTPAQVSAGARIMDDPLAHHVVISTQGAFRSGRPIAGGLQAQTYLSATIERRTGATQIKLWQKTLYKGARRELQQVSYRSNDRLVSRDLAVAVHEPDDCPGVDRVGSCVLAKTAAFELSEGLVREIASLYQPGSREAWGFRFKDRYGRDVIGGIAPAEASGLLDALEQWRAERGLPASYS